MVSTLAFSPDGTILASASTDGIVQVWSVQTGILLRTLHSQTPWVGALAFSQDGQFLALASDHKVLQLWRVESGALVYTLDGHMARVTTVTSVQTARPWCLGVGTIPSAHGRSPPGSCGCN